MSKNYINLGSQGQISNKRDSGVPRSLAFPAFIQILMHFLNPEHATVLIWFTQVIVTIHGSIVVLNIIMSFRIIYFILITDISLQIRSVMKDIFYIRKILTIDRNVGLSKSEIERAISKFNVYLCKIERFLKASRRGQFFVLEK